MCKNEITFRIVEVSKGIQTAVHSGTDVKHQRELMRQLQTLLMQLAFMENENDCA